MEKNNNKICKICNKRFSSGKAIGGHMRAHFAKLPIPPKPTNADQLLEKVVGVEDSTQHPLARSPSSSSSLTIQPGKNPIQNFRSLNRDFSSLMVNFDDKESESETYPRNPTRRRSKRRRKFNDVEAETKAEPKQVSSIFDAYFAEEAAWSLVMLSKDTWPERNKFIKKQQVQKKEEDDEEYEDEDEEEDDDDDEEEDDEEQDYDEDDSLILRAKFECEMCKKVFQSYQALGGHKASHKRIKNDQRKEDEEVEDDDGDGNGGNIDILEDRKGFECPYCFKVFDSGQALGGHKKVHFTNAKATIALNTAHEAGVNFIDLNLPAPGEDVQNQFSAVSDEDY